MRTFNRYFVHFMGIGAMILLVAVLLLVADGGELLVPIFMIALISVDTCFVVLMKILQDLCLVINIKIGWQHL